MVGGEFARSVGPLFITAAVTYWGLEGSYRVMPLGLIASLILFVKLRKVKEIVNSKPPKIQESNKESIRFLLPIFIIIGSFILTRAGIKSALTLYLPIYITSKGASLWLAGISLSIFQFSGAVGTMLAGYISDKIGKKTILLISAILSPLVMWLFLQANSYWTFPLLILEGLLLFAQGPVLLAYFQDLDTKRPAFVNSIYMTINFVVNSLIVLLVGISGDQIGLDLTYKIATVIALLAIPLIYILPSKNKKI
jgi:FSR family fosmidomycin resistance protein-like MFS transporter